MAFIFFLAVMFLSRELFLWRDGGSSVTVGEEVYLSFPTGPITPITSKMFIFKVARPQRERLHGRPAIDKARRSFLSLSLSLSLYLCVCLS